MREVKRRKIGEVRLRDLDIKMYPQRSYCVLLSLSRSLAEAGGEFNRKRNRTPEVVLAFRLGREGKGSHTSWGSKR